MKPKTRGRIRWEVEWIVLTESAKHRRDLHADTYEHDHDRDEVAIFKVFDTVEEARAFARKTVDKYETVYGHATVQEQRYLPIEGTVHFDWEPIGEVEYIE